MCGFCGVIGPAARAGADDVEAMARTLVHRGPDDFGLHRQAFELRGERHELGLGHTRLSILDLSPLGHQPMATSDGRFVIAFNGEIYNYRELRDELRRAGATFRSDSDTEVLLEGWRAWGEALLPRLNGMYAFGIFDAGRSRLVLARDPIGIKPLYFRFHEGVLAFGSELRALRVHRGFDPTIDRGSLGLYLRHGWVPGPGTIYAGCGRVMPGESLAWEDGRIERRFFLRPTDAFEEPVPASFEAAVERLDTLLLDAVERQMISDVPLGAFLSGGIDSSTVVALMRERATGPVRTFSIGFKDPAYDEAPHARAVAEHLGTDHTELYVGPDDARALAHELPDLYDEPFADASAIPTTLLSRLTRRHVTVALSGDGGDELFGGYTHYAKLARLLPATRAPLALRRIARAIAPPLRGESLGNALRHLAAGGPADVAYSLVSELGDGGIASAVGMEHVRHNETYARAWTAAQVDDPLRRAMAADATTYMVDDILVKVDRASMSVALEARVPILDHRVVRFALSLPMSIVWHGGATKAPLREVLYRRVPRALLERPKRGFGMPLHRLLAREMEAWTARHLSPKRIAEDGLFDPSGVAGLLLASAARRDERARAELPWRLICFQRWYSRVHRGESGEDV